MKKYRIVSVILFVTILFSVFSCTDENLAEDTIVIKKNKSEKLAEEVFKKGDIISLENSPKIISAKDVYNSLGENILIIDLRRAKDFASGHIKNSVNLKMKELIDYAQVRGLQMYDKVIMVCYTGQSASYSSAILQMLGHENLYVLKWGMGSWNEKFNDRWMKNVSDKGIAKLSNKDYKKNDTSVLPVIECKKNSGKEILYTRARMLMNKGFGKAAVKFKFLLANIKKSYVISYQPKELYEEGHLSGSVLYDSQKPLNISTDLLTLPIDKVIAVYSNDAHSSAYVVAVLRMLGYDAKTLKYGANSFMNSKMIELGFGFDNSKTQNYPTETSVYIKVEEEVQEGGC